MMHFLKLLYLNISFYILLFLFTAACIPVITLFMVFLSLFLSHRQAIKRFRHMIIWYGWVVVRILPFPLIRIEFEQHGKDESYDAQLFICNHRSLSDAWLMGLLSCEVIQIVKGYVYRIPVLGIVARLAGYVRVNEIPFEEFSRTVVDLLKNGVSVVSFPEGTRSGSREMGQFHGGIFRVALRARCPIVPLCISGTERIPARGSFLLRPGTIKVHMLPALRWDDYRDLGAYELKKRIRDIITTHLNALDQEVVGKPY